MKKCKWDNERNKYNIIQNRFFNRFYGSAPENDGTQIQVSYSGGGKFGDGLGVRELWTFVNSHRLNGVIQGVGQGIIKTIDNKEIALATDMDEVLLE
ncbi:MAG: hypothetical protein M3Y53_09190 [Thermoproteota archaeon]|nr:hypothetical protein [Thermoproteota archaeon]